jgi:hypothetical protein
LKLRASPISLSTLKPPIPGPWPSSLQTDDNQSRGNVTMGATRTPPIVSAGLIWIKETEEIRH